MQGPSFLPECRVSMSGVSVMVWESIPPYQYLGPFELELPCGITGLLLGDLI